jgi:UDP-glucuronate 4-epimerase
LIVDNFNDYYDPALKEARVKELKRLYAEAKIARVDISDYKALEEAFKEYSPDKICHLAAQAGVRYSLTHPLIYGQYNLMGTLNILELCRQYKVRDLVYASTSSVYGNNKKMPFAEKDKTDTQLSLYAATKKSNEVMAYAYHHLFELNCTGLRFFNVYGTWARPDLALLKFTQLMTAGKKIDVYNHGHMTRDFTYIDDIVDGIMAALDKSYPHEIFNLGRGEPVKLLDFIAEIEKNLGIEANKNMMPMQPGDVPETSADISKARDMLGYNPAVSIQEGVKRFIEWYREYYEDN